MDSSSGWGLKWVACLVVSAASLSACLQMERLRAQTRPIQQPRSEVASDENVNASSAIDQSAGTTSDLVQALATEIATRAEQLQSDTERTADAKDALRGMYQQAQIDLELAAQFQQDSVDWTKRSAAAPALLDAAALEKEQLAKKVNGPDLSSISDLSFEEGQVKLQALEADLAVATTERTRLADETAFRVKRRKETPQLISDAKTELETLVSIPAKENSNEDSWIVEAIQWSTEAARLRLGEQVSALEAELRAYDAEALLLPLQLELAEADQKRLQAQTHAVTQTLSERRKNRITAFAIQFREQEAPNTASFDRIREWLDIATVENTENGSLEPLNWRDLANKQVAVKLELEQARSELERWRERRTQMRTRVDAKSGQDGASGFNSWVGLMLRKQRHELPDPNQQSARLRYFQNEIQQADALAFDLDYVALELKFLDGKLQSGESASQAELLSTSQEIVAAMRIDVREYLNDLYQIADVRYQTQQFSYDYSKFIDKHVLWIRSSPQLQRSDLSPASEAFRWLISIDNWKSTGSLLFRDAVRQPAWYAIFLVGFLVLLANQSRLRRRLGQLSLLAEKRTCTEFSLTARAFLVTMLIAAIVPLVLLFAVWRISEACRFELLRTDQAEFSTALGMGCLLAAMILFPIELLRQICRPDGLGVKHFGWHEQNAKTLRSNFRWLIDLTIPLAIVIGMFVVQSNPRWEASLGRFAFLCLMPLLSVFFGLVFRPSNGVFSGFVADNEGGWTDRLSVLWYPALVFGPIALAVVSFIGYHYTSERIAMHLNTTLWMVVVLTVSYCLVKRWLVLNRRSLMVAQARQRLVDAAQRDPDSAAPAKTVSDEELNLVAVNEQTKRMVTSAVVATGLGLTYLIWSDVLPAVGLLDGIPLWDVQGSLSGETTTITLANVVLVVPLVVLMVIAARNVPGLLEIACLQHLPLTSAARYAITTLARYAIIAVGITIASSTIGLKWSNIQWLVAALGVGLGFGLQEIFANFVSGIILLFEQPIRVGDIITIDGTTGTVSKIRMRATTIVNWDRQELIVPNKDFITGKLLNWTLTDTTNRIVLNVGVAYGSDIQKACELIRTVCDEHPNVMRDPAPLVTFEEFGDNTLNLVLRAYLESLDGRLGTVHELHEQVYNAFNDAGIEIAFPQQDLHIRTLPENFSRWLGSQQSPITSRS